MKTANLHITTKKDVGDLFIDFQTQPHKHNKYEDWVQFRENHVRGFRATTFYANHTKLKYLKNILDVPW